MVEYDERYFSATKWSNEHNTSILCLERELLRICVLYTTCLYFPSHKKITSNKGDTILLEEPLNKYKSSTELTFRSLHGTHLQMAAPFLFDTMIFYLFCFVKLSINYKI